MLKLLCKDGRHDYGRWVYNVVVSSFFIIGGLLTIIFRSINIGQGGGFEVTGPPAVFIGITIVGLGIISLFAAGP